MNLPTIILVAACVVSSAGSVRAQEITNPSWAKPVQAELAQSLYPGFATLMGLSGRVTVSCRIEADGHPYLCDVADETPRGLGFGAAARVIVASGEIKAARLSGSVVTRTIRSNVFFALPEDDLPFGNWTGPEPSASRLALARQMVGRMPYRPEVPDQMDGLDFDRRQIVGEWIDELMPRDPARENEVLVIQLARLFDEDELRRIGDGQPVDIPSEQEFLAACPDPTPSELAAIEELKRRYCARWECGAVPTV